MAAQPKKSAFEKIIDYLAIRDHSEAEIRNKLDEKDFAPEEIESGLELAFENGFMLSPEELSQMIVEKLNRKNKGILYINQYLESKELPCAHPDWELELSKAKTLVEKKFNKSTPFSISEKQLIYRFLTNRGFADQTINDIVNSKNP